MVLICSDPSSGKFEEQTEEEGEDFRLEDETGFIVISLWGNDIKQLRGTSTGDLVRVTNVKTNDYYETVSLNSTDFTRIFKVAASTLVTVMTRFVGGERFCPSSGRILPNEQFSH